MDKSVANYGILMDECVGELEMCGMIIVWCCYV